MAQIHTLRLIDTLSTLYGDSIGKEMQTVLNQLQLPEQLQILQGVEGDGIAEIEKLEKDGHISSISFNEKGDLYLNLQPISFRFHPQATRFLLTSLFGKEELKEPLSFEESRLLEAAVGFYQCNVVDADEERENCRETILESVARYQIAVGASIMASDPTSSQMSYDLYNRTTRSFLSTMRKMLKLAEEEDWGPGGWDPDDFRLLYEFTEDLLDGLPNTTREEAKIRFVKTEKNFLKILQTDSGREACLELGLCFENGIEYYNGAPIESALKTREDDGRNREPAPSPQKLAGK